MTSENSSNLKYKIAGIGIIVGCIILIGFLISYDSQMIMKEPTYKITYRVANTHTDEIGKMGSLIQYEKNNGTYQMTLKFNKDSWFGDTETFKITTPLPIDFKLGDDVWVEYYTITPICSIQVDFGNGTLMEKIGYPDFPDVKIQYQNAYYPLCSITTKTKILGTEVERIQ